MHEFNEKVAQAKRIQMIIATSPTLRNKQRAKDLLRTSLYRPFIYLATAHYNEQLMLVSPNSPAYQREDDFEDMLDLAASYFLRNRSRLLEWWCTKTLNGNAILADEDRITLDISSSFNVMLKNKCKNLGIVPQIDEVHYSKCNAILDDGTIPEVFMNSVIKHAIKIEMECA